MAALTCPSCPPLATITCMSSLGWLQGCPQVRKLAHVCRCEAPQPPYVVWLWITCAGLLGLGSAFVGDVGPVQSLMRCNTECSYGTSLRRHIVLWGLRDCALRDCALGFSPVTSYSGVKTEFEKAH